MGARATSANAIALGTDTAATGNRATAFGAGALATGNRSTVMGWRSAASGTRSFAMGSGAMGDKSVANATYSLALGSSANANATSTATRGTAIGYNATVSGVNATALGVSAVSSNQSTVAIGDSAKASAGFAIALGSGANVALNNSVALGSNSTVSNAVAVPSATVNGITYSGFAANTTAAGNVVSVGSNTIKRQIQNVAAGQISATSTDAINSSQLYMAMNATGNLANSTKNILGGNATVKPDGSVTYTNIGGTNKNTIEEALKAVKTEVVAGSNVNITNATGANGQTIYTVNAYNTTANSSSPDYITVTGKAATAANTTNYEIGLTKKAIDDFTKDTQATVVSNDGTVTVKSTERNANGTVIYDLSVNIPAQASQIQYFSVNSTVPENQANDGAKSRNSIAIGPNATANGTTALGRQTNATAGDATAVGSNANATAEKASAFGVAANASANASLAVGANSIASAQSAVAVGTRANATAQFATALGMGAQATLNSSVALGSESVVRAATPTENATVGGITYNGFAGVNKDTNYVVSVGSAGKERQIQNVAAGQISATSTDAINGSQLYMAMNATSNLANSTANNFGGGSVVNPDGSVTQPKYNVTNAAGTQYGNTATNVGDAITNLNNYVNQGFNIKDNAGETKGTVTPNESVQFVNGKGTVSNVTQEADGVK
ncbi:TPA: adhesin [Mannheimia haemolytica]|nr:adhesin [Mannheimia haemolytica]